LNPVTIVVPIYGDWPSLQACLESLIAHAPKEVFSVLLVNDCGPDADEIEAGVLGLIAGRSHFVYRRNESNLGFVQTCNRAVFEIDTSSNDILLLNSDTRVTAGALEEMRLVLALSEHHGVVCPRSNDATIASLPFMRRDHSSPRTEERAFEVFKAISPTLPRYYVAPVAIGFCFLVKRTLIENYGFFDEIFGRGYNEENDFCLRINEMGFSALIANHAFVFHVGGASFGLDVRSALEEANSVILRERYPSYPSMVDHFIKHTYSPLDRFSDLLVGEPGPHPKVLIDLHHLPQKMDGSTRNALTFLSKLSTLSHAEKSMITVAVPPHAHEMFDLGKYGVRIINYSEIDEIFDVGVAISPVTSITQISTLNRYCLKWVVSFLDIIALRAWYLNIQVPHKGLVVKKALDFADVTVAISESTVNDVAAFFGQKSADMSRIRVVHQGAPNAFVTATSPPTTLKRNEERRPPYVLLVGNMFPHKQLDYALKSLGGIAQDILVLGTVKNPSQYSNVQFFESGLQSDETVHRLYSEASAVIFPSTYEGFGLPLPEAASLGKPVIAFQTETSLEVVRALDLQNVVFFSHFRNLRSVVENTILKDTASNVHPNIRTLGDYNDELWQHVIAVAKEPVDLLSLHARDDAIEAIALVTERLLSEAESTLHELNGIRTSGSFRLATKIAAVTGPIHRLRERRQLSLGHTNLAHVSLDRS
jgi:GT2 family glycosyltransferase